ncbi:hypothetical protein IAU60_001988 [Kwoniella sp. DSM 27419]
MTLTNELDRAGIVIRRARQDDTAGIVALGQEMFRATFEHTASPEAVQAYLDGTYTPDLISKTIGNPNRRCVVAVREGSDRVVGYVIMATDSVEECVESGAYDKTIEIRSIYTHSTTHGTGLGKRLAEEAFEIARKEGCSHVWLGVLPENARAVAFYTKLGFRKIGSHEFRLGEHVDVDDIMIRQV